MTVNPFSALRSVTLQAQGLDWADLLAPNRTATGDLMAIHSAGILLSSMVSRSNFQLDS
jgi:hypothetical protein